MATSCVIQPSNNDASGLVLGENNDKNQGTTQGIQVFCSNCRFNTPLSSCKIKTKCKHPVCGMCLEPGYNDPSLCLVCRNAPKLGQLQEQNLKKQEQIQKREKEIQRKEQNIKAREQEVQRREQEEKKRREEEEKQTPEQKRQENNKKQLLKWSGTPGNKQMVMLYKATRDGFTAKDFQLKCYGKGEAWVIISDVKGNVFGGYTSIGWKGSNKWVEDPASYVYTLVNPHGISPTKYNPKENRLCIRDGDNINFGADLYIEENSNSNNNSNTKFPHCYSDTTGKDYTTFTGDRNFQSKEIEVWGTIPI